MNTRRIVTRRDANFCAAWICAATFAVACAAPAVAQSPPTQDKADLSTTGLPSPLPNSPLPNSPLPTAPAPREASADAPVEFATLQALLSAFGIDESHFARFVDFQEVGDDETETLVKIMYRVPRIRRQTLEKFAKDHFPQAAVAKDPNQYRADAFNLRGIVTGVQKVMLLPEAAERFEFDHYYRIEMTIREGEKSANGIVFARYIPWAWMKAVDEGRPLRTPASGTAIFLKLGQPRLSGAERTAVQPQYVFAATRMAWHPDKVDPALGVTPGMVLLAAGGMDIGLFDELDRRRSNRLRKDIRELKRLKNVDRECFYQMLSAVHRLDADKVAKYAADSFDLISLLKKPSQERGNLYRIRGTARRIVKVPVPDEDIRERFGIGHYYEVYAFVHLKTPIQFAGDDEDQVYEDYPFTFAVRELPAGLTEGEEVHEVVEVDGFYCKLWSYRAQFTDDRKQSSPLLIADRPEWIQPERAELDPRWQIALGGCFIFALLGIWLGLWIYSRTDRQFEKETLARQFEVGQGESLDQMGLEAPGEPDFSRIAEMETAAQSDTGKPS